MLARLAGKYSMYQKCAAFIRKKGKLVSTQTVFLTFKSTTIPEWIMVLYRQKMLNHNCQIYCGVNKSEVGMQNHTSEVQSK
jgi:hypothetical protein